MLINLPILPTTDEAICITKWDQARCSTYIDAFDLNRLHRLGINLNACNTGNVSQIEIDIYAQDLCDIYILPAKLCGMEKAYRQNTVTKVKKIHLDKPWFDKECAKSHLQKYFRAKKRLKTTRSIEIQSELRNISKAYKRKIRSTSKKYYKSLNRKLRNLGSSNSKEFWNIINKECSDSTKDNNIALESFFEHFKNLSKDDSDINADNNNEFDPRTVTHGLNEEINNLFTSDL